MWRSLALLAIIFASPVVQAEDDGSINTSDIPNNTTIHVDAGVEVITDFHFGGGTGTSWNGEFTGGGIVGVSGSAEGGTDNSTDLCLGFVCTAPQGIDITRRGDRIILTSTGYTMIEFFITEVGNTDSETNAEYNIGGSVSIGPINADADTGTSTTSHNDDPLDPHYEQQILEGTQEDPARTQLPPGNYNLADVLDRPGPTVYDGTIREELQEVVNEALANQATFDNAVLPNVALNCLEDDGVWDAIDQYIEDLQRYNDALAAYNSQPDYSLGAGSIGLPANYNPIPHPGPPPEWPSNVPTVGSGCGGADAGPM